MERTIEGGNLPSQTEKLRKKRGKVGREILLYAGVFFLTLILFWTVKPHIATYRKGAVAQTVMALALAVCIAVVAYLGASKRLTTEKILFLLLLVGYILRVGYMLYTPASVRQQDTYTKRYDGHEGYAWKFFSTGKLPDSNYYQFYHPPLNAMVQAGFMHVISFLTNGLESLFGLGEYFPSAFSYGIPTGEYAVSERRYYLYSSCQVLSVFYSFVASVVLVKTVRLFSFSDKTKLFLSAFVVLYPRQIQFAGMLNNDGLSYCLGVLAMCYALKWQKEGRGFGWILACAFAVGLGMMAKLSSATVCLPIAGVFLYELVLTAKKKGGSMPWKGMLTQYAVFLAICAPIGLWFQIYASARFGQEFGFVFSNLNPALGTDHHSFFARFIFPFDGNEWFGSLYCRPFNGNYNLFHYALRSSIFGEFTYWQGDGFAVAATVTAYLSAILLAVAIVWSIVACARTRREENGLFKRADIPWCELLFVFLLVQSQALSEIYFYIKMPYACTMDFRYIMPLILGMALTLGCTRKILATEGGKFSVALNRLTALSVGAFLTLSALFYCTCI